MAAPTTSDIANPEGQGFDARLGTLLLRLANSPELQGGVSVEPDDVAGVNTATRPEEFMGGVGQTFARMDFTGGQGLAIAHRADGDPSDVTRFWDSEGIRLDSPRSGGEPHMRLAGTITHFAESWAIYAAPKSRGGYPILHNVGAGLEVFWRDDSTLYKTVGFDQSPPTDFDGYDMNSFDAGNLTTAGGQGLTVSGKYMYAAMSDGVHRVDTSGTHTHWSDTTPVERMWAAKGHIIGANDGELFEIFSGATAKTVLATVDAEYTIDARWLWCGEIGPYVAALSVDGMIHLMDDADGTLRLVSSFRLSESEYPVALAYVGGLVAVMACNTRNPGYFNPEDTRLYVGHLAGGEIVDLRRIWTWDEDNIPNMSVADGQLWFLAQEAIGTAGLWMYDPAFDSLMRVRETTSGARGKTLAGLPGSANRVYLFHEAADALYYYDDDGTYAASGHVISPLIDHYTAREKVWSHVRIFARALPAGTSAKLYYSTDVAAIDDPAHGSWTLAHTLDNTTGVDDSEVRITNPPRARWLTLKLELATTNTANTPEVYGFSVTSYFADPDVTVTLPVNISDRVERPRRRPLFIKGRGQEMWDALKALEGTAVTCELYHTDEVVEGYVERVVRPDRGWPRRRSATDVAMVTVRGKRQ